MDGSASGGGLPPRPSASTTRRRPAFVAPHRPPTSSSLDATLPGRQELPSSGGGSGGRMACPDSSGSTRPSPGGGNSGGRMPPPSGVGAGVTFSRRLPNDPPPLGPRSLNFTETHATTLSAGRMVASPAEVYEEIGDDFSITAQGQETSSIPSAKKDRPPGRKQSKEKLKQNQGDDEYKEMMQSLIVIKTEEHKMKKEKWGKDVMLEDVMQNFKLNISG